jgi:hypothetical protein
MDQDLRDLLACLSETPTAVAQLVNDLPVTSLVVRPSPDEFSVLENVCHLRDVEIDGYAVRIRRILAEDEPHLADVDGTRLAIERDYNKQDINEALSSFNSARNKNLTILKKTSETDLSRSGTMEGVGRISLERLLEMMCEHDESHLEDLRISRTRILRATSLA